jgi:hypothetical protein
MHDYARVAIWRILPYKSSAILQQSIHHSTQPPYIVGTKWMMAPTIIWVPCQYEPITGSMLITYHAHQPLPALDHSNLSLLITTIIYYSMRNELFYHHDIDHHYSLHGSTGETSLTRWDETDLQLWPHNASPSWSRMTYTRYHIINTNNDNSDIGRLLRQSNHQFVEI